MTPKLSAKEKIRDVLGGGNVDLEVPQNSAHGDYSTNIAMQMGGNPQANAKELVAKLQDNKKLSEVVEKIEVAGPGFINFYLKAEVLITNLQTVITQDAEYGKSQTNKGKRAIVEYSSPNIAKPFSIGHLRSTVIGDAVANLLAATGWEVLRDNHLGDWGTQFGKQIFAIKTWGDETKIAKSENPVKELVSLYVKFHEEAEKNDNLNDMARAWFKKLEDGDSEARRLWKLCIDWSWQEFDKIYTRLGFNGFYKDFEAGRGLGEAFFEDKMASVIAELKEKKLIKAGKEGAMLFFFADDKYPPAMILKKDGATLYHTRDLATDKYRLETYKLDLIVNEVGVEQKLYFEQLYEMEAILGWYKKMQRVHVYHGLVRLKTGKMSTRKGSVIWLSEVLDEALLKAKELGSESTKLAEVVSVGAIKWNDLKRDPKTEILFDWKEILNMQGNSGPYMQYAYARTQSIIKKSKVAKENQLTEVVSVDINTQERQVLACLLHFPEIVGEAAVNYAPNLLCNYLYDLASKFNTFYNNHKVIGGENEQFRLSLVHATGVVIKNGLTLLSIEAPSKM